MVNYEIDAKVLSGRVPHGIALDLHDGKCFVSVVGFMFRETRVAGFLIPFHINFEEVNLRFYVRRETECEVRRGVVFIKEIVPRITIAATARFLYGEPYEAWKMGHTSTTEMVSYSWQNSVISNTISIDVGENLGIPAEGSHEEFIIEHYWGYTRRGPDRTDEYKVEHPKWELFAAKNPCVDVDFEKTYGEDFGLLATAEPHSILLAKGSEIVVYKGEKIVG